MKIKRFTTIKKFKSFVDFDWAKFCRFVGGKDAASVPLVQVEQLGTVSALFGENGSGKSTLCSTLKSLSRHAEFGVTMPELAEVEVRKNGIVTVHRFENGNWVNGQLDKGDILFFDVDFINGNVHTHGAQGNREGQHSQNAGQLIIDLDAEAHRLKVVKDQCDSEVVDFKKVNDRSLKLRATDVDETCYAEYSALDEAGVAAAIDAAKKASVAATTKRAALQKLEKRQTELSGIGTVASLLVTVDVPELDACKELYSREVKERAQQGADGAIEAHFEKHRSFIEYAKNEIPGDYRSHNCPLCMQSLANAEKVIEYYRTAFDQAYDTAKKKMLADIASMKAGLSLLGDAKPRMAAQVSAAFDVFEKIAISFGVDGLYSVEEKTALIEEIEALSVPSELRNMCDCLDSLKTLEKMQVNIEANHAVLAAYAAKNSAIIVKANDVIAEKNAVIVAFKSKYADQHALDAEIASHASTAASSSAAATFLETGRLAAMRERDAAVAKLKGLTEAAKESADKLAGHLASTIPASVIAKMKSILGRFSLNLELDHEKPAPNTKSYTFSFKVKDRDGNGRQFKDGLSEGERQIISLAFFFAINDGSCGKDKKVLVLDDPITSLDAPNLKILAELIYEQKDVFGQVLVLTHHPLFFKYLSKEANVAKFGVLKNSEEFGGSFVYLDRGFDLTEEVKKCSEEIALAAASGDFRPEGTALKYGQLLRLAVERFIKNELLLWDKEKTFETILDELAPGKAKIGKLTYDDLTTVANLYHFCNWSNTMHVDKESPAALAEIMAQIDKFVAIIDRARS